MKKMALLLLSTLAIAGCSTPSADKENTVSSLTNRHFVLQEVNGQPLVLGNAGTKPLLSFGEQGQISGRMCNQFSAQATLEGNQLKAEHLAMTRMLCTEPVLNQLDNQLGQMLAQGAQVNFNGQQLTLKTPEQSLTYSLADKAVN